MTIEEYIALLLITPDGNSCVKAGKVLQVSHDQVTRLLQGQAYSGRDLFDKAIPNLVAQGGTLTVDDSVIDKPYSKLEANELVGRFWSGKHHRAVKGVNLLALVYTDPTGHYLPVNFRLCHPQAEVTKHQLLQEMLREVLSWGLRPIRFTADSWYASIENLKLLRSLEISFQVGVKSDRIVSTQPGQEQQVGEIEMIPEDGLMTHLRKFGFIKLFRTVSPDGDARHYIVFEVEGDDLHHYDRQVFKAVKLIHWNIEQMFRVLKQVCSLERFFVRKARAVTNHVFCALRAFLRLMSWQRDALFPSVYTVRNLVFLQSQRQFIQQVTA